MEKKFLRSKVLLLLTISSLKIIDESVSSTIGVPFTGCFSCWSRRACFLANVSNRLTNRWATYGCNDRNCPDMLANAAKQLVCKYLSRIFSILYWMVRMTTKINKPPSDISDIERSVYQWIFLRICEDNCWIFAISDCSCRMVGGWVCVCSDENTNKNERKKKENQKSKLKTQKLNCFTRPATYNLVNAFVKAVVFTKNQ